jgi:hypothetical protein
MLVQIIMELQMTMEMLIKVQILKGMQVAM